MSQGNKKLQDKTEFSVDRFVNREPQLELIDQAIKRSFEEKVGRIFGVWGVGKVGKTYLVNKVCDDYRYPPPTAADAGEVLSVACLVDLGYDKTRSAAQAIASLAYQLYHQLTTSQARQVDTIHNFTLEHIESLENDVKDLAEWFIEVLAVISGEVVPVILLDEVDREEVRDLDDYKQLINLVVKPAVQRAHAIVILSGRNAVGKNPYHKPSEQNYNLGKIEDIHLGNFTKEDVTRLVKQRRASHDRIARQALSERLYECTAGHPGLCDQLIDIVDENSDPQPLEFWQLIEKEVEKWIKDRDVILREVQEYLAVLRQLSVLRYFSPGVLQEFPFDTSTEALRSGGVLLINKLLRTQLVFYSIVHGGYTLDESIRLVLETILCRTDPSRWHELHYWAYEFYYELMLEYRLEPMTFLVEFWYHAVLLASQGEGMVDLPGKLHSLKETIVLGEEAFKGVAKAMRQVLEDPAVQRFQPVAKDKIALLKDWSEAWLDSFEYTATEIIEEEIMLVPESSQPQIDWEPDSDVYYEPDRLIGRKNEFEKIRGMVEDSDRSAVIAIVGAGGIGKTDLVREVIKRFADDDRFLIPTTVNEGIFDFAAAKLRDVWGLERAISNGIKAKSNSDAIFHQFEADRITFRRLREERIPSAMAYEEEMEKLCQAWVDDYNSFVEHDDRKVLLCFDTVERLSSDSAARSWLKAVTPFLRNTVVILSGRDMAESSITELAQEIAALSKASDSEDKKNVIEIKLNNLSKDETREYLQAIKCDPSNLDIDRYYEITDGHPVKISLLAGLPDDLRGKALEELDATVVPLCEELDQLSKIQDRSTEIIERRNELRTRIPSEKFRIISAHFVQRYKGLTSDPQNLYNLLILARRGLTADLLAFLLSGKKGGDAQLKECEQELRHWRKNNVPLMKRYQENGSSDESVGMLMLHDVVYEMLAGHWTQTQNFELAPYKKRLVEYHNDRLTQFENLLSEDYQTCLLDTIYYEILLDPISGYDFLRRQIDCAIRRGLWSLVRRLHDEWQSIAKDEFIRPLLPSDFPAQEQIEQGQASDRVRSLTAAGELSLAKRELETLLPVEEEDGKRSYELYPLLWIEWSYVSLATGNAPAQDLLQAESRLDAIIKYLGEKDNQELILADSYTARSYLRFLQLDLEGALEDLSRAAPIFSKQNLLTGEARVLCSLTSLSIRRGNLLKAHRYAVWAAQIGKYVGEGSVAELLGWRALANVYHAHGNLHWAEKLLQRIIESGALVNLPKRDLRAVYFDLAKVKSQIISQGLRMKDYNLEKLAPNIHGPAGVEMAFRQANRLRVCRIEQAELQAEWGEFYLHLALHHNIPDWQSHIEQAQSKFIAARDSLDTYPEGQEIRKAAVYVALSRLAFLKDGLSGFQDALTYLKQVQEQIDIAENRFKQELRRAFKSGETVPQSHTLEELRPELRQTKARLELMSGHLILKEDGAKASAVRDALDHYKEAIALFNVSSSPEFVSEALEEIWTHLTEAISSRDDLYHISARHFESAPPQSPAGILRDSIEQRYEMAGLGTILTKR